MVSLYIEATAEFAINILSGRGITLKKVKKQGGGIICKVRHADFSKIEEVLTEYGRTFRVISDNSINTKFKQNIIRFGALSGFVLVLVCLFIYSGSVTRVKIQGNNNVGETEIMSAIQNAAALPAKKSGIDRRKIEKEIIKLDGITSASAEIKGNTLLVSVYEDLGKVDIMEKPYKPVVSNFDAVITRAAVFSGTLNFKIGDAVKKGDILIAPYVQIGEVQAQERASGYLYGAVMFTKTIIYPPTSKIITRTGKSVTRYIKKGGNDNIKHNFKNYERVEEDVISPFLIPVKLTKITYYEVCEKEIAWDFEANKDTIIKDARKTFESELVFDGVRLETRYEVKTVDKSTRLDLYCLLEIKITP